MWDKLKTIYEGDEKVKEVKLNAYSFGQRLKLSLMSIFDDHGQSQSIPKMGPAKSKSRKMLIQ